MEYKLGDPERGKTIFEGIVESHPKRNDLWSVYLDMEASQNNIQSVRYVSFHHAYRYFIINIILFKITEIYSTGRWLKSSLRNKPSTVFCFTRDRT